MIHLRRSIILHIPLDPSPGPATRCPCQKTSTLGRHPRDGLIGTRADMSCGKEILALGMPRYPMYIVALSLWWQFSWILRIILGLGTKYEEVLSGSRAGVVCWVNRSWPAPRSLADVKRKKHPCGVLISNPSSIPWRQCYRARPQEKINLGILFIQTLILIGSWRSSYKADLRTVISFSQRGYPSIYSQPNMVRTSLSGQPYKSYHQQHAISWSSLSIMILIAILSQRRLPESKARGVNEEPVWIWGDGNV